MKRHVLKKYRGPLHDAAPAVASPAALVDGKGYPGSKSASGTWQRIIGQMPPHSVYLEGFLGSGQIFRRKRRAENSILIDSNPKCLRPFKDEPATRTIVGDALEVLAELAPWLPADTVAYFDPPYLLATRQRRLYYEHEPEVHDPAWHEKFLALVVTLKFPVLLSHAPAELYSSRLHGWRCCSYEAMTRGGVRPEVLWCNFPEPAELHDWRFAGLNARQRFAMKRFVARWLDRVEAMPARRRGYVLHELNSAIVQRHGRRQAPQPELVMATNVHAKALDLAPRAKAIAALCVSGRSIYKHLPGVTAYDRHRDARTFDAKTPAVAHPPCRLWSKFLSHQAKSANAEAERELGRWCVRTVIRCGGVVEQPAGSRLWEEMNLPVPNAPARDGCYTLYVEQRWFGYVTRKPTWLLICGVPKDQLPPVPFSLANTQPCQKPGLSSFARSRTMRPFAEWLCQIARRANPPASDLVTPPLALCAKPVSCPVSPVGR